MKEEKGFTLVEIIVAMAILTLVAVPIFKSFAVSAKVNVKSYEKDKANVIATDKIEKIKRNPHKFIESPEANTDTRYYVNLFDGAYYYCMGNNGTLDDKAFGEYVNNRFKIFPKATDWDKSVNKITTIRKAAYENKTAKYYDKVSFKELLNSRGENLSQIKCIINKCSVTEYYDSNWEVTTDKASAKYQAQIEVSRKAENNDTQVYQPETLFQNDDRYDVPFMESYFAVLTKGVDRRSDEEKKLNLDEFYDFYIFYNYTSEDFEGDLKKIYGTTTPNGPNDLINFFAALSYFQSSDTKTGKTYYPIYYDVFNDHEKAKWKDGADYKKFELKVQKEKTSIPVRIDFHNLSTKPMYEVEAYNMTDKPMELYVVHNETNDSEVAFKVSKGKVKKTEVYTTKNFTKTVYKIDVKVIRKEDNYTLINYKTEKYVSQEEAQDFNFVTE